MKFVLIFFIIFVLHADDFGNEKIHKIGSKVNCIYPAIHSFWTDGNEFVKNIAMECLVKKKNLSLIFVDCTKDLETKWSDKWGNIVKNHPLNPQTRWFDIRDCYEVIQ